MLIDHCSIFMIPSTEQMKWEEGERRGVWRGFAKWWNRMGVMNYCCRGVWRDKFSSAGGLQTQNPKHESRNPKHETRKPKPKPKTRKSKAESLKSKPKPKPKTRKLKVESRNTKTIYWFGDDHYYISVTASEHVCQSYVENDVDRPLLHFHDPFDRTDEMRRGWEKGGVAGLCEVVEQDGCDELLL